MEKILVTRVTTMEMSCGVDDKIVMSSWEHIRGQRFCILVVIAFS